jgi:hypothetical protein
MHAGTGRLSVILVGILAFLAAVIGDNIGSRPGTSAHGASSSASDATSCSRPSGSTKQPASSDATAAKS